MTTTYPAYPLPPRGLLDAAIAARDHEVVALRLALGVLEGLRHARAQAASSREELLNLISELGDLR